MYEFELGDLEYWRKMPFRTFMGWHRFAQLQAVNRKLRAGGT